MVVLMVEGGGWGWFSDARMHAPETLGRIDHRACGMRAVPKHGGEN